MLLSPLINLISVHACQLSLFVNQLFPNLIVIEIIAFNFYHKDHSFNALDLQFDQFLFIYLILIIKWSLLMPSTPLLLVPELLNIQRAIIRRV